MDRYPGVARNIRIVAAGSPQQWNAKNKEYHVVISPRVYLQYLPSNSATCWMRSSSIKNVLFPVSALSIIVNQQTMQSYIVWLILNQWCEYVSLPVCIWMRGHGWMDWMVWIRCDYWSVVSDKNGDRPSSKNLFEIWEWLILEARIMKEMPCRIRSFNLKLIGYQYLIFCNAYE